VIRDFLCDAASTTKKRRRKQSVEDRLEQLLRNEAIELDETPSTNALQLPHPFPAPMSPLLAEKIITQITSHHHTILDPMVGSGTVVVVASKLGRKSLGLDIDPLARLMVRVSVRGCDPHRIWAATVCVLADAFAHASDTKRLDKIFAEHFDSDTQKFIRFWFPCRSRRHLLALWLAVDAIKSPEIHALLALAFSRTIIAKTAGASYAIDLPHTRPHKRIEKKVPDPLQTFARRVDELLRRLVQSDGASAVATPLIRAGDARRLPYKARSVDLVLTSSPYANAIDYVRAHKFSLVWMGYSVAQLARLRRRMIGAELGDRKVRPEFAWLEQVLPRATRKISRRCAILRRYFYDLDRVIRQIHRVLKKGGACVLIVGRSTLGARIIDTPSILVRLAENRGFKHLGTRIRKINPLRRSLPFGTSRSLARGLGKRMSEEAVIGLAKLASKPNQRSRRLT
jgi:DNA modification methylase